MSSAEPVKVGTRPRIKHARPNSAVYIGSDPQHLQQVGSTPPSLPDLPEPPSPVSSSGSGSGLPSPPATNSTGSGSTGDPASIAFRGGTKGNMPLLEEPYVKAFHSAFEQQQQDHSQRHQRYDNVDDNDDIDNYNNNSNEPYANDDDTAKFNVRSQSNGNTTNDNARALERVRSLQERNRMALNKLSSYSRLSTPSPKPSAHRIKDTTSRIDSSSSSASHSTHSSSSSSSRPSIARSRHSYQPDTAPQSSSIQRDLSGSETERESARGNSSFSNSYDDEDEDEESHPSSILLNHTSSTLLRSSSAKTPGRPTTPSLREINYSTHRSPRSVRTRLSSAPVSPAKALSSISRSTSGSGGQASPVSSPGRPRKRASMGLPSISFDLPDQEREDLASVALAAVANSRRGLGGTAGGGSVSAGRRRQPLPREFWEGSSNTGSNSINGSARGDRVGSGSRRGSLSSSNGHTDDDDDDRDRSYSRSPSPSPLESSTGSRSSMGQQRDTRNPATLTPEGRRKYYSINAHTNNNRRTSGAWASEDLGNRSREFDDDDEAGYSPAVLGRRQNVRAGGSADSVLTIAAGIGGGGRSLLGEGLKAAGLSPIKNRDRGGGGRDVFATGSVRRRREDLVESPVYEKEREERLERIRSQSRAESRPISRAGQGHGRAATSIGMTEYSSRRDREEVDLDDDVDNERRPPGSANLRAYKSAYNLDAGRDRDRDDRERERDRAPSSLSRYDDGDRVPQSTTSTVPPSTISSLGARRYNTVTLSDIGRANISDNHSAVSSRPGGGASVDRSDHNRLLGSSLELFEAALSKIPSSSSSSSASNTIDLVRNARVIVSAVDKLNGLLKAGHGRALNAQIDCEVQAAGGGGGSGSAEEVWRLVGGEYREGLRVSDDLVRATTDFLLGVGRAVKDMGIVPSAAEPTGALNGDHHARSVSLDEAGVSRLGRTSLSPDPSGGSGGARSTGTGSVASGGAHSRRSWEPTPGRDTETLRRLAASRPETSLGVLSTDRTDHRTPINHTTKRTGTPIEPPNSGASVRRLLTPREMREQQLIQDEGRPGGMSTFDSQETLHAAGYEPSPTPASRNATRLQQQSVVDDRSPKPLPDRSRTLPPIAIPSPLPALPSESRQLQTPSNKTPASSSSTLSRRKTAHASSSTVRSPAFPLTTRDTPTTAVTTTHASGAPEKRAFPLVRGNSNTSSTFGGGAGGARSTVTFSRSSTTTALSGLQQQQQRAQEQRTRKLSNSADLRDEGYEYHNELADPPVSSNGVSLSSKGKNAITPARVQRMTSGGSETERDVYRRTGTVRDKDNSRAPRISFDESSLTVGVKGGTTAAASMSGGHPADRAAMSTIGQKRERRRTVVDMWPRGS